MSTRETIIKMLQNAGYDTMSACEFASNALHEFKRSNKDTERFHIRGGPSITLKRN